MTRLAHWPSLLDAAVREARTRTFEWGVCDCTLWVADVVHVMTGVDLAGDVRGSYTTQDEAAALIARLGGLHAIATARLGEPLPAPTLAQRGDVVLVRAPESTPGVRYALGVSIGAAAACKSPLGLAYPPIAAWRAAWRV